MLKLAQLTAKREKRNDDRLIGALEDEVFEGATGDEGVLDASLGDNSRRWLKRIGDCEYNSQNEVHKRDLNDLQNVLESSRANLDRIFVNTSVSNEGCCEEDDYDRQLKLQISCKTLIRVSLRLK